MVTYHEREKCFDANAFRQLDDFIRAHLGVVFPSISLAIHWHGDHVFDGAWAVDGHTTTPDTLFDLASVSKLFTTTAFLALVSERKVALDDALVSVIPEFGAGGLRGMDGGQDPHTRVMLPIPPQAHGATVDPTHVTFRHLLTHTSGLAPWRAVFQAAGSTPPPPDQPDPFPIEQRRANALKAICAYPFVGQADGVIRYSDLGFMLIGESVARLTGLPLDEAIHHYVTDRVHLKSVGYNPLQHGYTQAQIAPTEIDSLWRGRRCWGEVHDENACGLGGIAGHAGLFATARDVVDFGLAWRTGGLGHSLREQAIREQASTGDERRGLGWLLKADSMSEYLSSIAYGHTGFTGTSLWVDPYLSLVVACLTNRVYYGREKTGIIPFRRALHDIIVEILD